MLEILPLELKVVEFAIAKELAAKHAINIVFFIMNLIKYLTSLHFYFYYFLKMFLK
ncbi:protein of unknown function [Legionella micdadei]|uniref:Uncharacterized protein n=1 Tax=Legionella micdadei TaxID=451 RepID=A0A098GHN5_LEGMI|nr:protein of unknown function [Legionella micdadei]